mgnify:CR=1 FL=1
MTDLFGCACPHCGQPMPEQDEMSFTAFWSDVPHKIGKAETRMEWVKLTTAEKALAHKRVRLFYAWFKKVNKDASPLHPVRYLKHRRWEDETLPQEWKTGDLVAIAAKSIKSGKSFLCGNISAARARECIAAGLVTETECKAVGVL